MSFKENSTKSRFTDWATGHGHRKGWVGRGPLGAPLKFDIFLFNI